MSSLRLAIVNQKGGTGKTTLSVNLGAGFSQRGTTVLLDADPQESAGHWAKVSGNDGDLPHIEGVVAGEVRERIQHLSDAHRYVLIDCPPHLDSDILRRVLSFVDIVLIPIQPSPLDVWASIGMAGAVQEARVSNPDLRAYMVLNQQDHRNALSRSMHEALADFEIPVLKNGLARRAAFRSAALEGCSVYRLGKRGSSAVNDIEAIIEEVLDL
ncbi:ParA family partition ATPase [Halothiobacillus sp.]|uniref:ParA family partition ATPase n=1 Tax=Halothiobacillus sp. TaxID=1891311 RepID=UPI003D0BA523